jgi:hypothetical protein
LVICLAHTGHLWSYQCLHDGDGSGSGSSGAGVQVLELKDSPEADSSVGNEQLPAAVAYGESVELMSVSSRDHAVGTMEPPPTVDIPPKSTIIVGSLPNEALALAVQVDLVEDVEWVEALDLELDLAIAWAPRVEPGPTGTMLSSGGDAS